MPERLTLKGTILSLAGAILGAALVSAFAFFKDDITVRVASLVTQGDIGGDWNIETWSYSEGENEESAEPVPLSETANLKQLGYRVIGTIKSLRRPRHWDAEGYYNSPNFGLAYVTTVTGGVAVGTYTMQRVPGGAYAFLGFWTGVDCKGIGPERHQVLLKCPVVFLRQDQDYSQLKRTYQYHLDRQCEEVDPRALAEQKPPPTRLCTHQTPTGG